MPQRSAWRLGDASAFDHAMALADELLAAVLSAARETPDRAEGLRVEATRLRQVATTVDAFDRSAVEILAAEWSARLESLRGIA